MSNSMVVIKTKGEGASATEPQNHKLLLYNIRNSKDFISVEDERVYLVIIATV